MKKQVTVKEAIDRGQKTISYPTYGIMIVGIMFSIFLFTTDFSILFSILFLLSSIIIFPWIYWSFAIVHWRIWAFSNVEDVYELKRKAIEVKLIFPDHYPFNKTEIRTSQQKKNLEKIEPKLDAPEIDYFIYASGKLPKEMKIYNSKRNIIMSYTFYVFLLSIGILLFFHDNAAIEKKVTAIGIIGVAIFLMLSKKSVNLKTPQLIINQKGIQTINTHFIPWENIKSIQPIPENESWTSNYFLEIKIKDSDQFGDLLSLEHLEFSPDELEKIIKIYQKRNLQNKL